MNENAIRDILEDIVIRVISQLDCASAASAACGSGSACASGAACASGSACAAGAACADSAPIPVELSARHVHLSEADALALFGAPLTPARDLSQPGQFLCKERVRLIGPKGVMDNIAVLGPSRGSSQVEISRTDARILGVDAPVRQSGDIDGTPGIILASQTGIVGLERGAIVAARHIHMTPADAQRLGVGDNERVCVRLDGERPLVLEDVVVRVHENFRLSMHIDFDEGNSAGWSSAVTGTIIGRKGGHGLCRN